ncbi:MAG TPA: methyltransferase [Vicinamibacterales bacterium]|nr:methyltransferase [Vicinamibacterales bacterium]
MASAIRRKRERASRLPPLLEMAMGSWVSQAVYVAARLRIADALSDGPQSCDAIAVATGAPAHSLSRLLRALCSLGIIAAAGDGRFVLTALGQPLQADRPGSLRAMVLTLGEIHYQAWGALDHSIRTGLPAFPVVFGAHLFDHLDRSPDAGSTFHEAMTNLAALMSQAVLLAYDFAGIHLLVDVGGGYGQFLTDILTVYPDMRGILVDTPAVICQAKSRLEGHLAQPRCTLVAGNLLEALPRGGNLYLLSGVIHDWDDDDAIAILEQCRRAMTPSGRVLVVETVLPEVAASAFGALLDLNMLVMTGGRERTEREFRRLFGAAGLEITRMTPTLAPQWAIEGSSKS